MKIIPTFFLIACSFPIFLSAQIDPHLLQSIKDNDGAKVDSLLQTEIEINRVDSNGANVLMWAVYKSDLSIVKCLFDNKASIPKKGTIYLNDGGYYGNLTGIAAGEGKLDHLKYLIETIQIPIDEKEYDAKADTTIGWTALQWGAAKNKPAIVNYLISEKADTIIAIPELCKMYKKRNGHTKAISLLNSAISQIKQKEEVDSILYISYLVGLANTYAEINDYDKAIILAKDALKIIENSFGKKHPKYRLRLNSLAMFYKYADGYQKALPLFMEALAHVEKYLSTEDLSYGIQLNNLAMLYEEMGAYQKPYPYP